MPGRFFDSNIILYLVSNDLVKADKAEQLIFNGGTINIQVLNEVANVSRRKAGMSWTETRNFLSIIRELLDVEPIILETHTIGISLAERYGFSIYDAMIASAALLAECDILFSEDLQDGLFIENRLRVRNPL